MICDGKFRKAACLLKFTLSRLYFRRMGSQVILDSLLRVKHRLGPVTRKDGMIVPLFVDTVPLMFEPKLFKTAVRELAKGVRAMSGITVVAGGLTPGVPLAAGISLELGMRFAWVRKEPKGYSQNRLVDGDVGPGDKVVLVDDFYVAGEMKELFIGHLTKTGAEVTDILSIGLLSERLLKEWQPKYPQVKIHYLANYVEMTMHLEQHGMVSKELREVVEYFVTDPYHWQENKAVWNKFNEILPNELLAKA